jgi:Cdc6-like AAA superfamily ATPase
MSLQRIHSLKLEDYRLFRGPHVFEFAEGITIIRGPNCTGKTCILQGIVEGLTSSADGSGNRDMIPYGAEQGQPTSIKVDFAAGGSDFSITKRFDESEYATSTLSFADNGVAEPFMQGENATRCARALTEPIIVISNILHLRDQPVLGQPFTAEQIGAMKEHINHWLARVPRINGTVNLDEHGIIESITNGAGVQRPTRLLAGGQRIILDHLHLMAQSAVATESGIGSVILIDDFDVLMDQNTVHILEDLMKLESERRGTQFILVARSDDQFPTCNTISLEQPAHISDQQ